MNSDLDRRFHQAMVRIYERARDETGYVATRFLQMVSKRGGVAAARQLLRAPPSDGFTSLWEKRRLDLSVEFHVLLPDFAPLFTDEERALARSRLGSTNLTSIGISMPTARRRGALPEGSAAVMSPSSGQRQACWLVRAGHDAEHLETFITRGFVTIGWGWISGLDDLDLYESEEMRALLIAAGRGAPGADVRELLAFRDEMQVHDVVVTPDSPVREFLFGTITGAYEFSPVPLVANHRHFRTVEWGGRWHRDDLSPAMAKQTLWRRTVRLLPDQADSGKT